MTHRDDRDGDQPDGRSPWSWTPQAPVPPDPVPPAQGADQPGPDGTSGSSGWTPEPQEEPGPGWGTQPGPPSAGPYGAPPYGPPRPVDPYAYPRPSTPDDYQRAFLAMQGSTLAGMTPTSARAVRAAQRRARRAGGSAPRSPVRGWLMLTLVLVVALVVADRGLVGRVDPTLAVPRAGWDGLGVLTGAEWPTPGKDEQRSRILPEVTTTATGTHAFFEEDDGRPVTWSPCRPIRVVIDPTGAPDGFEQWLSHVLAEASALTGLSILLEGTTTERVSFEREAFQPELYGDRWAPAIVGWADDTEMPRLADNVVGLGGAQWVSSPRSQAYVTGAVVLDTELLGSRHSGAPAYVGVLRHEVGHMLGLGHVSDPSTLMYDGANSVATWGPGEEQGLAALGAGTCAPDL